MILDVGCGSHLHAKGDVNIDFFRQGQNVQIGTQNIGEMVNPHLIKNFIVADACHLPFKDNAFDVVFSSHMIEHVANPFAMYREMARVASRKVVVRCPHRRGSGAKRPFHLSYLDEAWFEEARQRLGYKGLSFVRSWEFITSKQYRPQEWFAKSIPWRVFKRYERRFGIRQPFELESWLIKQNHNSEADELQFFVATNNLDTLNSCFLSSPYTRKGKLSVYDNTSVHQALPVVMNRLAEDYIKNNQVERWLVFCHHDFILKQDLQPILAGKNVNAIYGVIGGRTSTGNLLGKIMQRDGSSIGDVLSGPEPVQTLDEMCLIVHSSLFRRGLRFDNCFKFHFYGADLCMQAYVLGFDVYALQVDCQHKSRTIRGDVTSDAYREQLRFFADKWRLHLPVKTSTRMVTLEDTA
jgi:hypothetical protein